MLIAYQIDQWKTSKMRVGYITKTSVYRANPDQPRKRYLPVYSTLIAHYCKCHTEVYLSTYRTPCVVISYPLATNKGLKDKGNSLIVCIASVAMRSA